MTKEEAYEFIAQKTRAHGYLGDPEVLRDEINKELNEQGWDVKNIIPCGGGFGFDVQPSNTSASPTARTPATAASPAPKNPNGVTCKKCNTHNAYLDTPSEPDGTHICYGCKMRM